VVIITAIVGVLLIFGLLWLFRSMGSFAQHPSPQEQARHNADEGHHRGPRASGLN
jgi:cytoskeletal protein RodZ